MAHGPRQIGTEILLTTVIISPGTKLEQLRTTARSGFLLRETNQRTWSSYFDISSVRLPAAFRRILQTTEF